MGKHICPTNLLEQAASVQDAWLRIDPKLTFGSLNLNALITDIDTLRGIEADLVSAENQLVALRNQRDALQKVTWDKVKRFRAGVKASYGDDSSEYEQVGGTRLSDKKTPRRIPPPVES
jgi:hypothetical protein